MKETLSEQELIKLLRKKNKEAIHQLYVKYSPLFLAICIRYFKEREEAKDAMHDGFMKILNSLDSFKGNGSFEGWMKRIIVNHTIDVLKKKNKFQVNTLEESQEPVEETKEEVEVDLVDINQDKPDIGLVRDASLSRQEIMEEVNSLPDMYKIILLLFVVEGLSHAAIANKLSIDEKASRTRLNRARKMIKQSLFQKSLTKIAK